MKPQKQVCDVRPGKRMDTALSNEILRVGDNKAWNAKTAGTLDPTRTKLNFEITKGGVIREVNRGDSIPKRIERNLAQRGIKDPNGGLSKDDLNRSGVGVRTMASIILEGTRDTMRQLAFGDQEVVYKRGADNTHVERKEGIEKWALDMYHFFAKKYGEDNIASFVVHLDETNPHVHLTMLAVTDRNKFSYNVLFGGKKDEADKKMERLHDELAEVNAKYGLARGESVALTGAKHKEYLQWMEEQAEQRTEALKEINVSIDEKKQSLYQLNAEIKRAETKIKGLTTMIKNLEEKHAVLANSVNELSRQLSEGKISVKEYDEKIAGLHQQMSEIENKIAERKAMIEEAEQKLLELGERRHIVEKQRDDIVRQINRELPTLEEKTVRDIQSVGWDYAGFESKRFMNLMDNFEQTLTPEQRKVMDSFRDEVLDKTVIGDLAEHGNDIASIASAIFLGFNEQAIAFAQGGGGGGSAGDILGRKDDEDDEHFRRRCLIMSARMMRPLGGRRAKRKRS